MRLPNSAQTSRPWRIHELTRDFRLEDVWELPTPGGPDDFPLLVQGMTSGDPSHESSWVVRALFAIRWKLGALLGWDGPDDGIGSRVPTLRDRLPADLRDGPSGPAFTTLPFTPLYLLDDEFAAEIANRTMHGVMHLAGCPTEPAAITARWPSTSRRTGGWEPRTWPRSSRSGMRSSTRRCCATSDTRGARRPVLPSLPE